MNFSILTPPPPHTQVPFFLGGVKTSLCIAAAVCGFTPRSRRTFFLHMDPLTHGGGPRFQLQVPPVTPPPPPMAPCQ